VRNIAGVVFQMCVQLCAQIALEAVKNHVWTPVAAAAATANGKIDKKWSTKCDADARQRARQLKCRW